MHRILLTLLLLPTIAPIRVSSATPPVNQQLHTRVSLVADASVVRPGSDFTVGVLMRMEKGWHTYWKNPGEAGLPTRVEWTLPDGIRVGGLRWPVPHKYNESGDVLTYGYADETMLLVPMHAGETLKPGSVLTLKAEVTWLECERICIPGKSVVELTLRVGTGTMTSPSAGAVAQYRELVPSNDAAGLDLRTTTEGHDVVVHATLRDGRQFGVLPADLPDFYPEVLEDCQIGRTAVEATPGGAKFRMTLSADGPVSGTRTRTLKGVLVYTPEGGKKTAVDVAFPLDTRFIASLAGPAGGSVLDRDFRPVASGGSGEPLLLYIVFAVIGGLLLNIMPCVLPVIALKVFGLVKMGGTAPARIRTLGWFFSLGILGSFLLLALIVILLQTAGETVGWGFQFQEPVFVLAMCAIVFVFGLSLFGVFEFQLPGSVVSGVSTALAGNGPGGKGYLTSFGEGVFATVLATPCTAPYLGPALGFAFSRSWWVILIVFASVAFGMALPYLVLTTRPSWTRYLPKPGEWMVHTKHFMGFLMMATLLWLLYVLGRQLGMEPVIWTSAFLLMLGIGCWVIGQFATLTASRSRRAWSWATAVLLAAIGYQFFVAPIMEARALLGAPSAATAPAGASDDGIPWQPFTVSRLDAEIAGGKTVFVDFTADWCLTCKVNEKTVLAKADIVSAFRGLGVVALRADWTSRNPEITKLLAKFGRSGVPLYVIFPASRPDSPIVLPEVITPGIVLEALHTAVPSGS
jgi:thiol:disulfide interchange protein/DsbC/DsbD-like thiol-disulfide interchange protein